MVNLENVDLLALQSRYMREDITTQAFCAALTPLLQELGRQSKFVILYPRINELSGVVLDELAWGLHVDAYDALASDDVKHRMILNSYLIHKFKGTAFAVQKIVESVFGEAGKIEEWPEYGGDPYHFRIDIFVQDAGVTEVEQARALELVNAGKNVRSELDGLRLILSQGVKKTAAAVGTWGAVLEVYPVGAVDTNQTRIASAQAQTTALEVFNLEG